MAKVSKKTHPSVSESERKEMLAKFGYGLRKIKGTDELCTVKKPAKKH